MLYANANHSQLHDRIPLMLALAPPLQHFVSALRPRSRPLFRTVLATAILATVAGLAVSPAAGAEPFSWTTVAEETIAALEEASQHKEAGDVTACKRAIVRAYFGIFEEQKMEAALSKMLGQSHTFMVERQFSTLRRNAATAAPAEFSGIVAALAEQLRADAERLDALGVPQEVYNAQ